MLCAVGLKERIVGKLCAVSLKKDSIVLYAVGLKEKMNEVNMFSF